MKTITINGQEFKIKYTLRALFIMEQITEKPFQINTIMDEFIFFYSMILANNRDKKLTWDEFIDAIDKNPSLLEEFASVDNKTNNIFPQEQETDEKKE